MRGGELALPTKKLLCSCVNCKGEVIPQIYERQFFGYELLNNNGKWLKAETPAELTKTTLVEVYVVAVQ